MEIFRTIEKPKNGKITIFLPPALKMEDNLEIIILPIETEELREKTFDPQKFFRIWREMDLDANKINQEMREEWEKNL